MADLLPQLVPVVVLQAGNLVVAVPASGVRGIHRISTVEPIPLASAPLKGATVVAGEAALVVDLPRLLDQPHRPCWPESLGVWGQAPNGSLVLVGVQVRWIGRLRRIEAHDEAPLSDGNVEWKGATLPLLSWVDMLEAALRSQDVCFQVKGPFEIAAPRPPGGRDHS